MDIMQSKPIYHDNINDFVYKKLLSIVKIQILNRVMLANMTNMIQFKLVNYTYYKRKEFI